jgi:uncharacterized protein with von Willebrand factor type A (vWA) domain
MFVDFFYLLRDTGVPVTPTAFLRLQSALRKGLILSLDDFYTAARCILVKSERHFDLYDRVFAHYFQGRELPESDEVELTEFVRNMLSQWLDKPDELAEALGVDEETLSRMTPEELVQYFLERLEEQTEEHHGGHKWIGTRGTSPVGHSGYHPGGMRVGGMSRNKSAMKVAMDRRYRDYTDGVPLNKSQIGEALKRLRNLVPVGPKDTINIDETLRQTMKNGGEVEIVYERSLRDRLSVVLLIDNGGWSMEPYVDVVQNLFSYAKSNFKDLKTFFFHNTVYDYVWEDPRRIKKPFKVDEFPRYFDQETRIVFVGDASMAPYELMATDGSIHVEEKSGQPSVEKLKFLASTYPYSVWLNPKMEWEWGYTRTIQWIREIFPMFELSISGLEKAVQFLQGRRKP